MLEAACERVEGGADPALHARIAVRLALELNWSGDYPRAACSSTMRSGVARDSGDPRTLAYVLKDAPLPAEVPSTLPERRGWAEELIALAEPLGDPELLILALIERAQTTAQAGEARPAIDGGPRARRGAGRRARPADHPLDRTLLPGRRADAREAARGGRGHGGPCRRAGDRRGRGRGCRDGLRRSVLGTALAARRPRGLRRTCSGRERRTTPASRRSREGMPRSWRSWGEDRRGPSDPRPGCRKRLRDHPPGPDLADRHGGVRDGVHGVRRARARARASTRSSSRGPTRSRLAAPPRGGSRRTTLGLLAELMGDHARADSHFGDALAGHDRMGAPLFLRPHPARMGPCPREARRAGPCSGPARGGPRRRQAIGCAALEARAAEVLAESRLPT